MFELQLFGDVEFLIGTGYGDGELDSKSFNSYIYGSGFGDGMGTYEKDGSGYGEAGLNRRYYNVSTIEYSHELLEWL